VDLIARPTGVRRRDLQLIAKVGLAAFLAWWICGLLGAVRPAFAAIVPLVAVRADDPYGALGVSVLRVAGTVAGILLGILALWIDPSAPLWLVAVTIATALAVGAAMHAPGESINPVTAVTALIIIFVGRGRVSGYAWERIWETFVGGAITMIVAVTVWPPDPIVNLRELLHDLRTDVSSDLRDIARLPGISLREADGILEDRLRRSMVAGDVTHTIDKANSALRWNPRHRGRQAELFALAVPIRQLMAMSRYSRSMLWSMIFDPDGDHIRTWPPDVDRALREALDAADGAAGAVADLRDPIDAIDRADDAMDRFAAGTGSRLATDLHGGVRAMLRVLRPSTGERIASVLRERYGHRRTA
jgi:uncharacterized membrane protein YgaE (UPF0421/DUF939 family)